MLLDRANLGTKALEDAATRLVAAANGDPAIAQAFSPFRATSPRLFADVDRVKALMLDVPLENVFSAMQIYLGSVFVNELNLFGRTFRVTAQADIPFRDEAADLFRLKTRNRSGNMVPLGSIVDLRETTGPDRFVRYNLFPAAEVQGAAARGYSTDRHSQPWNVLPKRSCPQELRWSGLNWPTRRRSPGERPGRCLSSPSSLFSSCWSPNTKIGPCHLP